MSAVSFNLAGVAASEGGGGFLETDYYQMTVTGAKEVDAKSGTRKQWELDLAGDAGKTKAWINLPTGNDKAGMFQVFAGQLQSLGFDTDGEVAVDPDAPEGDDTALVGRTAHIFYKAGDRDANIRSDVTFLVPAVWEEEVANGKPRIAKAQAAAPAVRAVTPPAPKAASPKVTAPSASGGVAAAPPRPNVPPPPRAAPNSSASSQLRGK